MSRKQRALGLTVAAVLAVAALQISTALATAPEFKAESGIERVTSTGGEGEAFFMFTNGANTISGECFEPSFEGSLASTSTTSITVALSYAECGLAGLAATIDWHGCELRWTLAAGTNPPTATEDIVNCTNADKSITYTAGGCTIHIPEQTGIAHALWSNKNMGPNRTIKGMRTDNALKYRTSSGCPGGASPGLLENGMWTETVELTGETSTGVMKGLWVE